MSEGAPKNEPQPKQPITPFKRNLRRSGITALAFAGGLGAMEVGQRTVNTENIARNHAFTVAELPVTEKLRLALGSSLYSGRYTQGMANRFPSVGFALRNSSANLGLIHLYRSELTSLADATENIRKIRLEAKHPVLISADIEGGLINHFKLTQEDLRKFGIPERMLVERQKEYEFYVRRHNGDASKVRAVADHPLPSQEWLGRVYSRLTTDGARQKFLDEMQGYGKTIAKICEHAGINLVFGPNLDIVENIDGSRPAERDDRAYGSRPDVVSALAGAYIRGFKDTTSVVVVPKHFVGTNLAEGDPHREQANVVIRRDSGMLVPYRDVINNDASNDYIERRTTELRAQIERLRAKNIEYEKQILAVPTQKGRTQVIIAANQRLMATLDAQINTLLARANDPTPIGGIMTAVTGNNLWGDPRVPTVYSRRAIHTLTGPKSKTGLGLQGVAVTDDLSMESSRAFIAEHARTQPARSFEERALAVHQALASGNHIAFIRGIAGEERRIISDVVQYMKEGVDLNKDGVPDLTEADLNRIATKVLDLHVRLGFMTKQVIRGEDYYVMKPEMYNPTTWDVLKNSLFSNQWPFTTKDRAKSPKLPDQSFPSAVAKATKNFVLSLWRVNVPTVLEKYAEAEKGPEKMIVIDKSARHLWIYNRKTGALEQNFDIAIGKGGVNERRYIGDHVTPTGTYQLVGKRDAQWWLQNKGQPFPMEYGGQVGGMLVLAGQWHPEIAIHGSPDGGMTGEVSNGCVRVENVKINELMNIVPTGTMVIVTK